MATLPKVLINRADYQIGGGVPLRLRTQGRPKNRHTSRGADVDVIIKVSWINQGGIKIDGWARGTRKFNNIVVNHIAGHRRSFNGLQLKRIILIPNYSIAPNIIVVAAVQQHPPRRTLNEVAIFSLRVKSSRYIPALQYCPAIKTELFVPNPPVSMIVL
jgi:hypothetical protein